MTEQEFWRIYKWFIRSQLRVICLFTSAIVVAFTLFIAAIIASPDHKYPDGHPWPTEFVDWGLGVAGAIIILPVFNGTILLIRTGTSRRILAWKTSELRQAKRESKENKEALRLAEAKSDSMERDLKKAQDELERLIAS